MARIFLSHSSKNLAEAQALRQWLIDPEREELRLSKEDIFLDADKDGGIAVGERWKDALSKANRHCEAIICLLSKHWETSPECIVEFRVAENLNKQIFIARLESSPGEQFVSTWQWCDLFGGRKTTKVTLDDGQCVRFSDDGLARLQHGIAEAGIGPESFTWPPQDDPGRSPYRGWDPFEEKDAAVFFGRDTAIMRAQEAVRGMWQSAEGSVFVILGPSGAGKSSFLKAGLMPRLRREDRRFLLLGTMRPERNALAGSDGFAKAIHTAREDLGLKSPSLGELKRICTTGDTAGIADLLQEISVTAAARFEAVDPEKPPPPPALVLPLDQAEELFRARASDEGEEFARAEPNDQAERFLNMLRALIEQSHGRYRLMVAATIRTDRYEAMQTHRALKGLGTVLFDELRAMPPDQFREVITRPAARAAEKGHRVEFATDLVDTLVGELREGADTLPLLSLTLARLYDDYGKGKQITLTNYTDMGGMSEVVQNEIDAVLSKDADQRQRDLQELRAAFIPNLVRINPKNDQPMRRVAPLADLPSSSHQLIEKMVKRRLLVRDQRRISEDGRTEEVVVEVALESLLRHWTQLVVWLQERLFDLKTAEAILRGAANWAENECEARYLVLSGTRLQRAETLAGSADFANHLAEARKFLEACRAAEDEEVREAQRARLARLEEAERKARDAEEREQIQKKLADQQASHVEDVRRRSTMLKGALAIVAAAGLLAGFLYVQSESRLRDTTARKLVSSSQAILSGASSGGDSRAFQQLAAAEHLNNRPDEGVIRTAVAKKASTEKIMDAGHGLYTIAYSPGGDRIAAAGISNDIQIWDTATGKPVYPTLVGHQGGRIYCIAFSPDGHHLAAAGDNGTIRLWNVDTGRPIDPPLKANGRPVLTLAFDRDGRRLATSTADGSALLWDLQTRTSRVLPNQQRGVNHVAFSPTGEQLATAGRNGSIMLWQTDTALPAAPPLTGHAGEVTNVAFSPDTPVLVSTGKDDSVRMWNLETHTQIGTATGHQDDTFSPAFSRDGRFATTSADHTVRLWDAYTMEPLALLDGHQDAVHSVAFSSDGRHVASASLDHTVRLWNVAAALPLGEGREAMTGVAFHPEGSSPEAVTTNNFGTVNIWNTSTKTSIGLTGHDAQAAAVAVSRDGIIATGGTDGLVKLWDARTHDPIGPPIITNADVRDVAFSSDGETIAVAADRFVQLFNVDTRAPIAPALEHSEAVNSVAFNPDGATIATASDNDAVTLWTTGDHPRPRELGRHDNDVLDVAFNKDGTLIATGGRDNTVRFWNPSSLDSASDSKRLLGHQAPVRSVAFSPDGTRLVSASDDKTLRVWDTTDGHAVGEPLTGHDGAVRGVAYSPDGALIASVSEDKTVRLWPGSVTTEMLCNKLTENMSTRQWDEWVSASIDYEKPCTDLPVRHDLGG